MKQLREYMNLVYQYIRYPHYLPNVTLGKNVVFEHRAHINAGNGHITIGDRCAFNKGVILDANFASSIILGNNVIIGPYVVIIASSHNYQNRSIPIRDQGHRTGEIIIKDDVWIGANAVILPDVIVGEGAVIGAGAIVTHDVEPYMVVGGVPASVIKERG